MEESISQTSNLENSKKNNKEFTIQEKSNKNFSSLVNSNNQNKEFTITKRVAKHGKQAIIVIPKILELQLKPGTLTKLTIEVLEERE
ncbi:MAG: hypothetical protein WC867_03210 [Candidatus Pacearchaeota archaeon]|jgi:hypothetical protein